MKGHITFLAALLFVRALPATPLPQAKIEEYRCEGKEKAVALVHLNRTSQTLDIKIEEGKYKADRQKEPVSLAGIKIHGIAVRVDDPDGSVEYVTFGGGRLANMTSEIHLHLGKGDKAQYLTGAHTFLWEPWYCRLVEK